METVIQVGCSTAREGIMPVSNTQDAENFLALSVPQIRKPKVGYK